MAALQQNPAMNWEAKNLSGEWNNFEQHAKLMFQGPLKKANEEEKATYILIWVGQRGREIFNSWGLSEAEAKNTNTLFTKFQAHTRPKTNKVFARYKFHERKQHIGESFEDFVTDLRNLVRECGFANDAKDEMVRDRIVAGVTSSEIREKLLNVGDTLTMQSAITIVTSHEATKQYLSSMNTDGENKPVTADVDAIKTQKQRCQQPQQQAGRFDDRAQQQRTACRYCGSIHPRQSCPAYGQQCRYCRKQNHYEKVCQQKKKNEKRGLHSISDNRCPCGDDHAGPAVDSIDDRKPVYKEDDSPLFVDSINHNFNQPDTVYANIVLETGDSVKFKVDTGAQCNVIPLSVYSQLRQPPPIMQTKQRLYSYTGQLLDVRGSIDINVSYKGTTLKQSFAIVDIHHSQAILGLKTSLSLNIIKLVLSVDSSHMTNESVLKEFEETFTGLGSLEGEITIHIRPDAIPVVHPPRRVPIALRDKLQAELKRMEDMEVIQKVTQPTDWVNSLVIVEKPNGDIRICLDPKNLNEAIRRPHYAMPTLEDALAKMAGAKYFSKLDAKSGYWNLKLDEGSSYFTTFNTPFGRYRFKRLPFGVISAQDEFQRKMDEVFEGLPGVTPLVDDVVVTGTTREEHDANLRAALQRATERNLKLNPDKLTVGAQEIKYFGHLLTADGLKPDPDKVRAIVDMPPPADKKELQTLLGMITYLGKFVTPQLSEVTKPLRDLLKEENDFSWDSPQQAAFATIKQIICEHPVLAFFDPAKPVTLQVDASQHGLGAALMQEDKPVAFASKSLNTSEQQYAQIEKELYAILFGCKRFHQYVYGRSVRVQTDHKPLEIIAKKPLVHAPPRLQRMLLQLQKYDLNIIHVPGKSIPVADTLSRKFLPADPLEILTEDLNAQVHTILKNMPVSDNKMMELRKATAEDPKLHHLIVYVQSGWPESRRECHPSATVFWNFREEMSLIDGILFKGEKIFVPSALRPSMLKKIHEGHFGVEKSTQRAREVLFWPGMTVDIQNTILSCHVCISKLPSNPKEPLMSHDIPSRPWQKVATDLFSWNGRNFMITVDYYSRFFEIDELTTTSSAAIIRKLSAHFARHGIPETLISDNGPQYSSDEFSRFAASWDFCHLTSSPGYPQSNGLAERTVQTAKNILDKAKADGTSPLRAILQYRTSPVDGLASPSQLLMGRQLRDNLPSTHSRLTPKMVEPDVVIQRRRHQQDNQRRHYNRSARQLTQLKANDKVFVQRNKGENWQPAKVVSQHHTLRSFIIQTENGSTFRRNRRFLRSYRATSPKNTTRAAATLQPTPPIGANRCQRSCGKSAPKPTTSSATSAYPSPASGAFVPLDQHVTYTRFGRPVTKPARLDL